MMNDGVKITPWNLQIDSHFEAVLVEVLEKLNNYIIRVKCVPDFKALVYEFQFFYT